MCSSVLVKFLNIKFHENLLQRSTSWPARDDGQADITKRVDFFQHFFFCEEPEHLLQNPMVSTNFMVERFGISVYCFVSLFIQCNPLDFLLQTAPVTVG
jgi:hypothetical protein